MKQDFSFFTVMVIYLISLAFGIFLIVHGVYSASEILVIIGMFVLIAAIFNIVSLIESFIYTSEKNKKYSSKRRKK